MINPVRYILLKLYVNTRFKAVIIIIPTNRFKLSYILHNIKIISEALQILYFYLTFKVIPTYSTHNHLHVGQINNITYFTRFSDNKFTNQTMVFL